jgi:peptidoglycan/LPS O-acetylase OafA/YrhL
MASADNPEPDSRTMTSTGRLPSLDGLRAISIILVLLGHAGGPRGFQRINLQIGDYAHLGVVVFFVISGFLITSLLMHEYDTTRRISLRLFYARRTLRIFPASYFYLCVICLLSASNFIHLRGVDIWHAFTYTVNFFPGRSWQVGHLWSLSVEEQFYLLWPFAFAVSGPRKANRVAWAVIALAIVAQIFTNDREKLGAALGHDVSHSSAHVPEMKLEQAVTPQRKIAPEQEHSFDIGLGL